MSGTMIPKEPVTPGAWYRAMMAAVVHLIAPDRTGGIRLRSHAGPVRDAWLAGFSSLLMPSAPLRRVPAQIGDSRLLGGLDLAATLQAGHPVAERGLLAEAHDGFILLAMAERLDPSTAAKLASVMDRGVVVTERDGLALVNPARFGVVALDEGLDEEQPPLALTERLGLVVDLREITHREIAAFPYTPEQIQKAQAIFGDITVDEAIVTALCGAGEALGIAGVRAPLQAVQAARALAALAAQSSICDEDVALAAMLVLAPRATRIPELESQEPETLEQETAEQETAEPDTTEPDSTDVEPSSPLPDDVSSQQTPPGLEDIVLEAALASLPPDLLAALRAHGITPPVRSVGKTGQVQKQARRGRVIGSKPGDIRGGARLDVIATLRHAAPWQKLRHKAGTTTTRVCVRREDFHIAHFRQRAQTTTIFVVDASGSSALQRLAEAKGAVRLLLSECYVRRDEVALIAFRGTTAEVILPPTRSLVRAQRTLAALPGGGGTPIAAGIDAAASLAHAVRRAGRTPSVVIMTDGRANVRRNGHAGRTEAQDEARMAARMLRQLAVSSILIDTSPKPQPLAGELAMLLGARYVPLPHANAERVAQAVHSLQASPDQTPRSRSVA
jgi:magnesium chelatase subunit D